MPADSISLGALPLFYCVLSWGATYFIHSTCLIAAVWLFVRSRRTAGYALRETMWKTALVGGVATASVQMWLAPGGGLGEFTLNVDGFPGSVAATTVAKDHLSAVTVDTLNRQQREFDHGLADEMSKVDSADDIGIATLDANADVADAAETFHRADLIAGQNPARQGARSANSQSIGAWRAACAVPIALALLAIVLGTARCGWQTISLRRKLAYCHLIDGGPARELLDQLLQLVPRAPKVLLLSAPDDSEPAALGIVRWTIVLPPRATLDLSPDELRALLAHELAHLVRGDSLWLGISRALCSCLAFQPLNHLARREWQRSAEFLCDNWAVTRTGAPLALARCLTEVASWRLAGHVSSALLAATGRKSGLVDRIERLLDTRPVFETGNEMRDRRRTVFAGVIVLASLIFCAPRVLLVAGPGEKGVVREGVTFADAAKPQASGERPVREEQSQVEAVQTESEITVQRAAGDTASMLETLDRDLRALEGELEQLGPFLKENAVPQAIALARRLRGEIVRLQHSREVLKALSHRSEN
jgi:hypothetical protein